MYREINYLNLTLPHEEVAADVVAGFSDWAVPNSSASPHEQSLQAFRFPVVPHTKKRENV
jgi:hypothetical protein